MLKSFLNERSDSMSFGDGLRLSLTRDFAKIIDRHLEDPNGWAERARRAGLAPADLLAAEISGTAFLVMPHREAPWGRN